MNSNMWQMIAEDARRWVLEAGQNLRTSLEDGLQIEYKTSAADLVTQKDRETEQFLVEKIKGKYPSHYILGEEGVFTEDNFDPLGEVVWVIDPIDGTTNFVHQKQNFVVSIGVYEKGIGKVGIIYDPVRDECFHARDGHGAYLNDLSLPSYAGRQLEESVIGINAIWLIENRFMDHHKLQRLVKEARGTRSYGAAALEMAYVACGRLDAYLTLQLSPWDYAGGLVVLNEVGVKTTTVHSQPINELEKSSVFAAHPALHQEMINKIM